MDWRIIYLLGCFLFCAALQWDIRRMRRRHAERQRVINDYAVRVGQAIISMAGTGPMEATPAMKARADREREMLMALLPQAEKDRLAKFHTCYVKGTEGRLWHCHWVEAPERPGYPQGFSFSMRWEVMLPNEGKVCSLCVYPTYYRIKDRAPKYTERGERMDGFIPATAAEALLTMILWIKGDEKGAFETAVKHGWHVKAFEPYQIKLLEDAA